MCMWGKVVFILSGAYDNIIWIIEFARSGEKVETLFVEISVNAAKYTTFTEIHSHSTQVSGGDRAQKKRNPKFVVQKWEKFKEFQVRKFFRHITSLSESHTVVISNQTSCFWAFLSSSPSLSFLNGIHVANCETHDYGFSMRKQTHTDILFCNALQCNLFSLYISISVYRFRRYSS